MDRCGQFAADAPQVRQAPSETTRVYRGQGQLATLIIGLQPGTRYGVKIVVEDTNKQRAAGVAQFVNIASTAATLVPGVSVTTLGEAQIVTADATTNVVTLSAGVAAPVPGQILASEKGGGVLATVIQSSAQPDGTTAVITTPAALGDVVSQLEFSGSFSLSPVRRPVAARAALQSLGVPTQSNQGGTLSMTWPQTGFTLTSDVTQPDRPAERTQTLRQSQATSSGLIVV